MATGGCENASDEIISYKCCVCVENKITREAEKYCVECQDYYCVPCSDVHKKFPLMKGHKLLDKADFNTTSLQSALPCLPTERCPFHKTKLLDMYCKNHDVVICATCSNVKHRTCQDIHSIPDEVDTLYKESASAETMVKLTTAKKIAEDIKDNRQHLLKKLKENRKMATNAIIDFRKEMEKELKKLESETLKEVDAEYEKKEISLLNDIKEVEQYTVNLDQSADKLAKSNGNKAQEFVTVKISEKYIIAMERKGFEKQDAYYMKIDFFADLGIQNFLKNINTLGRVVVYEPRTTVYTVKQQRDVNVKLREDKETCRVTGSCFIGDSTVLLADCSNKKLKRLNIYTNTIKDHLNLKEKPIAVCKTNEQEAVVSLWEQTIQFVSLGDKMAITKSLKMGHFCSGLAYNEGKLFISDDSNAVYIHDVTGTVLNKIKTDKSGNSIFDDIGHFCFSKNRETVYVADVYNGLTAMDTHGNHLSTDVDLAGTYGICTDGRGNMIVCGWTSSNIVQISEKSKTKLGVLGTFKKPVSACFVPHQSILYVTSYSSNKIRVYELE